MFDTIKLYTTKYEIKNYESFKNYKEGYVRNFFENLKNTPNSLWNNWQLKTYFKPIGDEIYRPKVYMFSKREIIDRCGYPVMYIEFSVPKLMYGNNLAELPEANCYKVVQKLVDILKEMGIIVNPEDIFNARLKRIDFSKNYLLPKALSCNDVFDIIRTAKFPHLKLLPAEYAFGGVKFNSKSLKIIFYDKLKEMQDKKDIATDIYKEYAEKGQGVLRAEIQIKKYGIANILKKIGYSENDNSFENIFKKEIFIKIFDYVYSKLYKSIPQIVPYRDRKKFLNRYTGFKDKAFFEKIFKYQTGNKFNYSSAMIYFEAMNIPDKYRAIVVKKRMLVSVFSRLKTGITEYKPFYDSG